MGASRGLPYPARFAHLYCWRYRTASSGERNDDVTLRSIHQDESLEFKSSFLIPLTTVRGSVTTSRVWLSFVLFILHPTADRHVPSTQSQLSQFVLQRLTVHTKNCGRARHVAACFFQTACNVASFEFSAIIAKVRRVRD